MYFCSHIVGKQQKNYVHNQTSTNSIQMIKFMIDSLQYDNISHRLLKSIPQSLYNKKDASHHGD